MQDIIERFRQTVLAANREKSPLRILGSGSKSFYGRVTHGDTLDTRSYSGIVSYEPSELVLTARCGTPLTEIEAELTAKRQMLPFEPPHLGLGATLGGCIACGLSGPRRAYTGAVRDYVLGVRMIDGKGDTLKFGGQVMKNVAGYDVSRLMAGSFGTLGLILDVSLKVLPIPVEELSLNFAMTERKALEAMNRWAMQPLSLSATSFHDGLLTIRLSGASATVRSVRQRLGGEFVPDAESYWQSVREQHHPFFQDDVSNKAYALWRLSLPSNTPKIDVRGRQFIEWGGALRWLVSDVSAVTIRQMVTAHGGQATLYRCVASNAEPFQSLSPSLMILHQRLKKSFDPNGIFNPGRIYREL